MAEKSSQRVSRKRNAGKGTRQQYLTSIPVLSKGNLQCKLVDNYHKLILDEDETEWQLKCPKIFDDMITTDDTNVKFCSGCNTNVYLVKDTEEMDNHTKQGHCIAFYMSRRYEMQARLSHQVL